ncbi:long-chain-alcohol oxidase FAO4A [Cryptomeria japonica]|uniref:long-chain-alcohol oxidase FAO4A n=1 Tax=Cryptomeria japonica TaxID=3369 RepID=UPI0027DA2C97|nr:long-chain-alcohol oxidase FAO4A [Cryptomeria japonica]
MYLCLYLVAFERNNLNKIIEMGSYGEKIAPSGAEPFQNDMKESAMDAHSLLRGGRPSYENKKYSEAQMEALTVLCDTLFPSLDNHAVSNSDEEDALKSFYGTSASQAGIPLHVAGYMSERLAHASLGMLSVGLWLLSTWYGTFMLCGRSSLSCHFPYFQRFSQVGQHRREEIMLSWSHSSFYLFRLLFKAIKCLCCLTFYTKVDEKNENPSWKAMGYCGPDPELLSQRRKEATRGPLHDKVIDLQDVAETDIANTLHKAGCEVIEGMSPGKGKKKEKAITIKCDVVVVGSGSGGGVVAGVLAKAGHKVIVVEKGKYFARNDLSLLEGPSLDQMYEGGGLLATDDLGVVLLAGSTVGGGSSINWSASINTPTHVISEWSDELSLPLFSSQQYSEAMSAVCERMGVKDEVCSEGLGNEMLRKGCAHLNYDVLNVPRNGDPEHRCGWCGFGCKDGTKQGTQETWLVDAVNHGAVILSSCKAERIIITKAAAAGIVIQAGNRGFHMEVQSRATVVSCGALCSPVLLKKSGLKNPNIGRNLHLHPCHMAWGFFPDGCVKSYEGPIITAMHPVGNPSGYGGIIETPSHHPGMFSVLMPWISALDMRERMLRYSRTCHLFALARDTGSGTVNPQGHLTYSLSSHDEKNLNKGIEKVLRILVAAGAQEIGTHHCKGERLKIPGSSAEEIERFIKNVSWRRLKDLSTPLSSAHQMGSCRMGADERVSAVDWKGESWEVKGLFVADASVLPTALGVNPMLTVQSIAYCIANFVHQSLKNEPHKN